MSTLKKNIEKINELNASLEQALYGTDTGEKSLETNINQVNADFQAIKTSLIDKGVEVAEGTRTADYAGKIDDVYDKGAEDGHEALWDVLFNKEVRKGSFQYAFYRWETFDFGSRLDGIKYKNVFWMFAQSGVRDLNIIFDLSEINGSPNNMFYSCDKLERIKKVIFSDNGVNGISNNGASQMFYSLPNLKEIRFEGMLDSNINIAASTLLSKDSIRGNLATDEELAAGKNLFTSTIDGNTYYGGLITLLSSTTGRTLTISKTAVINAFGSNYSDQDSMWMELITPKTSAGWTINLS